MDSVLYKFVIGHLTIAALSQTAPGISSLRPRPSISPGSTVVRGIFDPILPLGSERREAAKSFLRAVRGLN